MIRIAAKWGFGNAPLKASHKDKTVKSIRNVLSLLGNLPEEATVDQLKSISHIKGQFTRTVKQDQWDWSTVWHLLGSPSRRFARGISTKLGSLRSELKNGELQAAASIRDDLYSLNIEKYLNVFLRSMGNEVDDAVQEGSGGHIYILSTRSFPKFLKIGMTQRSVETRMKEINSATGVMIPFGVRASWKVDDAKAVETAIHKLFYGYRVRDDREFFEIEFYKACKIINYYLRYRRLNRRERHIIEENI